MGGRVAVETGRDVVERPVVAGAAGDAGDDGVDGAEVVLGVLVGERDESSPQRRGVAGAAGRREVSLATVGDDRAMPPTAFASPATSVTVSPRPSIPRSSNGWMPYATRNCCGV